MNSIQNYSLLFDCASVLLEKMNSYNSLQPHAYHLNQIGINGLASKKVGEIITKFQVNG